MKHYYDPATNAISAYEDDGSQDHLIPSTLLPITSSEMEALLAPTARQNIERQIKQLEGSVTPRRIREAVLGDTAFIAAVEAQITSLRAQL